MEKATNKRDKKLILVGRICDIETHLNQLNIHEVRNKEELNIFIKSDSLIGCSHGESCESIKKLLEINDSLVKLIDLQMLLSVKCCSFMKEKDLYKFLNTRVITIENPLELNLTKEKNE